VQAGDMTQLAIDGVTIEDTFAEAFGMRATRLIVTAADRTLGTQCGAFCDRLRHLGDRRADARPPSSASCSRTRRRPMAGRAWPC
jgi:hypothetical protein